MFKKNLKLLATMVGLVTVLVTVLVLPGTTQQTQLSRASILNAIQAAMGAQLTAAVGEQLALDAAVFFSNYYGSTWAFVPPRFLGSPEVYAYYIKALEDLKAGKEVELLLGGFYISEATPKGLAPGFYLVRTINKDKAVLLYNEEVVAELPISLRRISLEELTSIMNIGGFPEPFPAEKQIPVIVLAGIPNPVFNGGGTAGPLPPSPPSPQPPPPPPPPPTWPWKHYVPGQICFSVPVLPFVEWDIVCIDP
ncbi:MAG: hypothetical protein NZ930_07290 [Candidatus Bipolaricaulota bacterium]|nr:hypothetical protein [Candidatus Bipolaricaulota bacterium]MDW8031844.1 hypothetical protein [Candidatus Bipolaricaulota bacterium]